MRIVCISLLAIVAVSPADELFDLEAIQNAKTLNSEVLQGWHRVPGPIATRQKLVTIKVGEIWPGQEYCVPVRLVVPADRKAKGFHLTGSHTPNRLKPDAKPNQVDQVLLRGGVGLVQTVVQEPGTYGERELARESEARFAKTLNPHFKIQYWAGPATLMRAITTAYAEEEHFEYGKVAASGGSKNGASPSMAILHDERMTAVHATVSPIWDSPLRHYDPVAREKHQEHGGRQRGFSGGPFGPNFAPAALAAGHTWKDLQNFAGDIAGDVFISRNLNQLRTRGVEMLFHPGTHDFVAYDLAWGGAHHPDVPVYLGANTGHGKRGHPKLERDQANKAAFLLRHFFPDETSGPLLPPPEVETKVVEGNALKILVRFPKDAGEEGGRIFWMFDRAPDGSPRYLTEPIPEDNFAEMHHDRRRGAWVAEIELDPKAKRIDFFTNHRKTIRHRDKDYRTYISSPYTRVKLSQETAPDFWDEIPKSSSTTIPDTIRDGYWRSQFQRVNRAIAEVDDSQVVFFGDSITLRWSMLKAEGKSVWEERFAKYNPINMGNSGDITPGMLYRVTRGNLGFARNREPRVAVILAGTNNYVVRQSDHGRVKWDLGIDTPPSDVAHGIRAIAQQFRRRLPRTRVIVLGILPVKNQTKWKKCEETNRINSGYRYPRDEVVFLDLKHRFLKPDGSLKADLFLDGTHLTTRGYAVLADELEPVIDRLIKLGPIAP